MKIGYYSFTNSDLKFNDNYIKRQNLIYNKCDEKINVAKLERQIIRIRTKIKEYENQHKNFDGTSKIMGRMREFHNWLNDILKYKRSKIS